MTLSIRDGRKSTILFISVSTSSSFRGLDAMVVGWRQEITLNHGPVCKGTSYGKI
jgi:hypothetical protein